MNNILDELNKIENIEIKENISFKTLTTFKVGGIAKYVVFPNNIDSLKNLMNYLKEKGINYKVLGNGSNTIPSDKNYDGIIIKLTNLTNFEINNNILMADAGCSLMKLANDISKQGYTNLEWACGIPGTIGGAIYMNAGAYKKSISDIVLSVTILDENNNIKELLKHDLIFSYRNSIFMQKNWICLKVKLDIKKGNQEEIEDIISDRRRRRLESQPLDYPSAGSVFENPEGLFAGHLIEECNLKGYRYGGAEISSKHANFIINKDNATASDIKYLIDMAKKKVYDKYNINLKMEQELFNWE